MPDKPSAKGGGLMAVGTFLQLEVTDRCNFRCAFCTSVRKKANAILDFDTCIEVLEKTKDISVHGIWANTVQLNGSGEPFLYPRLFDVVRESKKRFRYVEFITNGYLMTGDKIDELLNTGIDMVSISLTGIAPEIYAQFQGSGIPYEQCKKQLDKVIANVKTLLKRREELKKKTYVRLRYIKSEESGSREHLKEYIRFWKNSGVDDIFVTSFWDYRRIYDRNKKIKVLRCFFQAPRYQVCANGDVFPCGCNLDIQRYNFGNVYTTPVENIITSEAYLNEKKARMSCNLKIVPKTCLSCEYRAYRDFFEELKNSREKIFLKSPLKTVIYKLFGPGVILFERITRIKFFYGMYLAYLRMSSARIRKQFLKTKQKE
jgi:radical SAM protein with 4Fe4S-binding SPASM domain